MKNINSSSFLNLIKSNLNLLLKIGGVSLLAAASQTLIAPSAFAGTNLTPVETFQGKVDYTVTGGTLRSNSNTVNACSLNSTSSAQLSGIPTNATIRKAYLYWSGSGSTVDNQIKLDGTSLTANRTYTEQITLNSTNYDFFQGVKDVTSIVAAKRNGTYQFSDLSVSTSSTYCSIQTVLSGWSLAVVYDDPAIPNNKLNTIKLYEGFKASQNQSVNYTLSGISIASNPVAKFTMLLWEGDVTLDGTNEFFKFNNNLLTDTYNPVNNQFNSSINSLYSTSTYGVDLDTFDVSNKVTAGATSVTGTVSTNNDLVLQGAALMMVTDQLAVQPPNQAPLAVADIVATNHGAAKIVDVLANDTDPENQALTIHSVTNPSSGTVQIVTDPADGKQKVRYTPNANFARDGGSDTFSYTVRDTQGASSTANVTMNIGPQPNRLPSAINDTVSTGRTAVTINVLQNDSDLDNDAFEIDNVTNTTGSQLQIITDPADGKQKLRFTPSSSVGRAATSQSFTYTIKDIRGGISSPATVTVNINAAPNDPPDAVNDTSSTAYGALVTIPVLDNDTDSDNQPIAITSVDSSTGATVQIVDVNGQQQVQYTPRSDFNRAGGSDSFTYTIADNQGATDSATVTVSVAARPNSAPDAVNDISSTAYGALKTIDVMANDSDPEGDTFTITSVTSGTGANVQIVDGKVQYTPKSDFNTAGGTDTFTYIITDNKGATDSATVSVTVAAKPDVNVQGQSDNGESD